jgi:hypothetical protein
MLFMAPELPNDRDFWRKLYTAFDPFRPLPAGDPAWVDCSAVRGDENVMRLGLEKLILSLIERRDGDREL